MTKITLPFLLITLALAACGLPKHQSCHSDPDRIGSCFEEDRRGGGENRIASVKAPEPAPAPEPEPAKPEPEAPAPEPTKPDHEHKDHDHHHGKKSITNQKL